MGKTKELPTHTAESIEKLDKSAAELEEVLFLPAGDVLVVGRRKFDIVPTVIRLSPEIILSMANTVATGAMATLRAMSDAETKH